MKSIEENHTMVTATDDESSTTEEMESLPDIDCIDVVLNEIVERARRDVNHMMQMVHHWDLEECAMLEDEEDRATLGPATLQRVDEYLDWFFARRSAFAEEHCRELQEGGEHSGRRGDAQRRRTLSPATTTQIIEAIRSFLPAMLNVVGSVVGKTEEEDAFSLDVGDSNSESFRDTLSVSSAVSEDTTESEVLESSLPRSPFTKTNDVEPGVLVLAQPAVITTDIRAVEVHSAPAVRGESKSPLEEGGSCYETIKDTETEAPESSSSQSARSDACMKIVSPFPSEASTDDAQPGVTATVLDEVPSTATEDELETRGVEDPPKLFDEVKSFPAVADAEVSETRPSLSESMELEGRRVTPPAVSPAPSPAALSDDNQVFIDEVTLDGVPRTSFREESDSSSPEFPDSCQTSETSPDVAEVGVTDTGSPWSQSVDQTLLVTSPAMLDDMSSSDSKDGAVQYTEEGTSQFCQPIPVEAASLDNPEAPSNLPPSVQSVISEELSPDLSVPTKALGENALPGDVPPVFEEEDAPSISPVLLEDNKDLVLEALALPASVTGVTQQDISPATVDEAPSTILEREAELSNLEEAGTSPEFLGEDYGASPVKEETEGVDVPECRPLSCQSVRIDDGSQTAAVTDDNQPCPYLSLEQISVPEDEPRSDLQDGVRTTFAVSSLSSMNEQEDILSKFAKTLRDEFVRAEPGSKTPPPDVEQICAEAIAQSPKLLPAAPEESKEPEVSDVRPASSYKREQEEDKDICSPVSCDIKSDGNFKAFAQTLLDGFVKADPECKIAPPVVKEICSEVFSASAENKVTTDMVQEPQSSDMGFTDQVAERTKRDDSDVTPMAPDREEGDDDDDDEDERSLGPDTRQKVEEYSESFFTKTSAEDEAVSPVLPVATNRDEALNTLTWDEMGQSDWGQSDWGPSSQMEVESHSDIGGISPENATDLDALATSTASDDTQTPTLPAEGSSTEAPEETGSIPLRLSDKDGDSQVSVSAPSLVEDDVTTTEAAVEDIQPGLGAAMTDKLSTSHGAASSADDLEEICLTPLALSEEQQYFAVVLDAVPSTIDDYEGKSPTPVVTESCCVAVEETPAIPTARSPGNDDEALEGSRIGLDEGEIKHSSPSPPPTTSALTSDLCQTDTWDAAEGTAETDLGTELAHIVTRATRDVNELIGLVNQWDSEECSMSQDGEQTNTLGPVTIQKVDNYLDAFFTERAASTKSQCGDISEDSREEQLLSEKSPSPDSTLFVEIEIGGAISGLLPAMVSVVQSFPKKDETESISTTAEVTKTLSPPTGISDGAVAEDASIAASSAVFDPAAYVSTDVTMGEDQDLPAVGEATEETDLVLGIRTIDVGLTQIVECTTTDVSVMTQTVQEWDSEERAKYEHEVEGPLSPVTMTKVDESLDTSFESRSEDSSPQRGEVSEAREEKDEETTDYTLPDVTDVVEIPSASAVIQEDTLTFELADISSEMQEETSPVLPATPDFVQFLGENNIQTSTYEPVDVCSEEVHHVTSGVSPEDAEASVLRPSSQPTGEEESIKTASPDLPTCPPDASVTSAKHDEVLTVSSAEEEMEFSTFEVKEEDLEESEDSSSISKELSEDQREFEVSEIIAASSYSSVSEDSQTVDLPVSITTEAIAENVQEVIVPAVLDGGPGAAAARDGDDMSMVDVVERDPDVLEETCSISPGLSGDTRDLELVDESSSSSLGFPPAPDPVVMSTDAVAESSPEVYLSPGLSEKSTDLQILQDRPQDEMVMSATDDEGSCPEVFGESYSISPGLPGDTRDFQVVEEVPFCSLSVSSHVELGEQVMSITEETQSCPEVLDEVCSGFPGLAEDARDVHFLEEPPSSSLSPGSHKELGAPAVQDEATGVAESLPVVFQEIWNISPGLSEDNGQSEDLEDSSISSLSTCSHTVLGIPAAQDEVIMSIPEKVQSGPEDFEETSSISPGFLEDARDFEELEGRSSSSCATTSHIVLGAPTAQDEAVWSTAEMGASCPEDSEETCDISSDFRGVEEAPSSSLSTSLYSVPDAHSSQDELLMSTTEASESCAESFKETFSISPGLSEDVRDFKERSSSSLCISLQSMSVALGVDNDAGVSPAGQEDIQSYDTDEDVVETTDLAVTESFSADSVASSSISTSLTEVLSLMPVSDRALTHIVQRTTRDVSDMMQMVHQWDSEDYDTSNDGEERTFSPVTIQKVDDYLDSFFARRVEYAEQQYVGVSEDQDTGAVKQAEVTTSTDEIVGTLENLLPAMLDVVQSVSPQIKMEPVVLLSTHGPETPVVSDDISEFEDKVPSSESTSSVTPLPDGAFSRSVKEFTVPGRRPPSTSSDDSRRLTSSGGFEKLSVTSLSLSEGKSSTDSTRSEESKITGSPMSTTPTAEPTVATALGSVDIGLTDIVEKTKKDVNNMMQMVHHWSLEEHAISEDKENGSMLGPFATQKVDEYLDQFFSSRTTIEEEQLTKTGEAKEDPVHREQGEEGEEERASTSSASPPTAQIVQALTNFLPLMLNVVQSAALKEVEMSNLGLQDIGSEPPQDRDTVSSPVSDHSLDIEGLPAGVDRFSISPPAHEVRSQTGRTAPYRVRFMQGVHDEETSTDGVTDVPLPNITGKGSFVASSISPAASEDMSDTPLSSSYSTDSQETMKRVSPAPPSISPDSGGAVTGTLDIGKVSPRLTEDAAPLVVEYVTSISPEDIDSRPSSSFQIYVRPTGYSPPGLTAAQVDGAKAGTTDSRPETVGFCDVSSVASDYSPRSSTQSTLSWSSRTTPSPVYSESFTKTEDVTLTPEVDGTTPQMEETLSYEASVSSAGVGDKTDDDVCESRLSSSSSLTALSAAALTEDLQRASVEQLYSTSPAGSMDQRSDQGARLLSTPSTGSRDSRLPSTMSPSPTTAAVTPDVYGSFKYLHSMSPAISESGGHEDVSDTRTSSSYSLDEGSFEVPKRTTSSCQSPQTRPLSCHVTSSQESRKLTSSVSSQIDNNFMIFAQTLLDGFMVADPDIKLPPPDVADICPELFSDAFLGRDGQALDERAALSVTSSSMSEKDKEVKLSSKHSSVSQTKGGAIPDDTAPAAPAEITGQTFPRIVPKSSPESTVCLTPAVMEASLCSFSQVVLNGLLKAFADTDLEMLSPETVVADSCSQTIKRIMTQISMDKSMLTANKKFKEETVFVFPREALKHQAPSRYKKKKKKKKRSVLKRFLGLFRSQRVCCPSQGKVKRSSPASSVKSLKRERQFPPKDEPQTSRQDKKKSRWKRFMYAWQRKKVHPLTQDDSKKYRHDNQKDPVTTDQPPSPKDQTEKPQQKKSAWKRIFRWKRRNRVHPVQRKEKIPKQDSHAPPGGASAKRRTLFPEDKTQKVPEKKRSVWRRFFGLRQRNKVYPLQKQKDRTSTKQSPCLELIYGRCCPPSDT